MPYHLNYSARYKDISGVIKKLLVSKVLTTSIIIDGHVRLSTLQHLKKHANKMLAFQQT